MSRIGLASVAFASLVTAGCQTAKDAGETLADGAQSAASSAISLVNVDLSNVLNDLSLDLDIDKANIPINAQIPITVAANICGVSINILSVSTGGQANCTATTTSPELAQIVQQQIAAGGNVGGGGQTTTGTEPTSSEQQPAQESDTTEPDPQSSTPQ